jgi:hypothetical protein
MILSRREMLKASGVALALPLLDLHGQEARAPRRLVAVCATLGLHGPFFFPDAQGASPYLDLLKDHRDAFTVFSGLSHPDQSGADGHTSEQTWLTTAKHPGLGGFRNTISIDQLVAEKIGFETRVASLVLGTSGTSQSYTRGGIMLPAESRPSRVFARLFLDGSPAEVEAQRRKLAEGRSILDALRGEVKRLEARAGAADREKLEEYAASVREMELRLAKADAWALKPKPKVDAKPPQDAADEKDLVARARLLFDLVPLALRTDSTRLATVLLHGRNDVPPVPGVTIDHHNLSHHGQDPAKIAQLRLIEAEIVKAFGGLLDGLKAAGVLDSTCVLFGSNLGNANSHDTRNLPILLAGGGFRHGGTLAFDAKKNLPLANLFVQVLRRTGVELDAFGSSTSAAVPGFGE